MRNSADFVLMTVIPSKVLALREQMLASNGLIHDELAGIFQNV